MKKIITLTSILLSNYALGVVHETSSSWESTISENKAVPYEKNIYTTFGHKIENEIPFVRMSASLYDKENKTSSSGGIAYDGTSNSAEKGGWLYLSSSGTKDIGVEHQGSSQIISLKDKEISFEHQIWNFNNDTGESINNVFNMTYDENGNLIFKKRDLFAGDTFYGASIYGITDNPIDETEVTSKAYVDRKDMETLVKANNYSDIGDAKTLANANSYTDASSTKTLSNANSYSDMQDIEVLKKANNYSDNLAKKTLSEANSYTDSKISALEESLTKEYRSATATAIALAVSPILSNGNKHALGIGLGHYEGENAVAVNYVAEVNKNVHVQLGTALNSNSTALKGGVSFGF